MVRILALLSLLATTGCIVYPYGGYGYGYGGGYGYRGYGYGYTAAPYGYGRPYDDRAIAATNFNPETGSRTGN